MGWQIGIYLGKSLKKHQKIGNWSTPSFPLPQEFGNILIVSDFLPP